MADYSSSKPAGGGAIYPENAVASEFYGRLEPLITPAQLKSRFLKGIPLILKIRDPETQQFFRITDDELKDYILTAMDEAENETGLFFMPTQFSEKLPYQRQDFEQFGYQQIGRKPISSIESLTVRLSDQSDIFVFPTEWIETGNLVHGQLNIIPLAFQGVQGGTGIIGGGIDGGSGTSVFFNSLWNREWVAALFNITYTTGFPNGMMPRLVNQLVGNIVTMQVLSQLAAAFSHATSTSLGIDGLSQSVSGPGPNRYTVRMKELQDQRNLLVRKLKKLFGTGIVVGTV